MPSMWDLGQISRVALYILAIAGSSAAFADFRQTQSTSEFLRDCKSMETASGRIAEHSASPSLIFRYCIESFSAYADNNCDVNEMGVREAYFYVERINSELADKPMLQGAIRSALRVGGVCRNLTDDPLLRELYGRYRTAWTQASNFEDTTRPLSFAAPMQRPRIVPEPQKTELPPRGAIPQFRSYPAAVKEFVPNVRVVLNGQTRDYRTRLRAAAEGPVNFAGHYTLTTWGCGMSCRHGGVLNRLTGETMLLPFTICCWRDVSPEFQPVEARPNSNLVVFAGLRNERDGDMGVHFYRFDGRGFHHVMSYPDDGDFRPKP